jgi:hypothetical protein
VYDSVHVENAIYVRKSSKKEELYFGNLGNKNLKNKWLVDGAN